MKGENMSDETTLAMVRGHLDAWRRGDVPALLDDYADDAVVMSAAVGALVGKDAIGAMFTQVFSTLFRPEDTRLEVTTEIVSGNYALVQWTVESALVRPANGFDTFILQDGKIVAQTGGVDIVLVS
jgi:ketosteroid isomerase-like protein